MDVPAEAAALEKRLRDAGLAIQPVLDAAGIDRSTWTRWKSGDFGPRLENWLLVQKQASKFLQSKGRAA